MSNILEEQSGPEHHEYIDYLMSNKRITIHDLPRLLAKQFDIALRIAEVIVDEWATYLRENGVD
jgi:hypothetical protein